MTRLDGWDGIEGIVLDAVGTLIDPDPRSPGSTPTAAARQGLVVDVAEVKRRFGLHFRNDEVDEQLGPMATDEAIEHRRWRRIVANVLPDLPDLDRGFDELWDHFGRPDAWRCFADVGPGLAALREAGLAGPGRLELRRPAPRRRRRPARAGRVRRDPGDLVRGRLPQAAPRLLPAPPAPASACRPTASSASATTPRTTSRAPSGPASAGVLLDRDGRRPPGLASMPDLARAGPGPGRGRAVRSADRT